VRPDVVPDGRGGGGAHQTPLAQGGDTAAGATGTWEPSRDGKTSSFFVSLDFLVLIFSSNEKRIFVL